jgi:mono/diheme cytochrome c family protein
MTRPTLRCLMRLLLAAVLLARSALPTRANDPAPAPTWADDLFRQSVLPVLKQRCLGCHGDDPKKVRGNLDLRTRAGLLKGGKSGRPALVPGEPDRSRLYVAVTRRDETLVMPPKDTDRLTAAEVDAIRRWVAGGAPWPDAVPAAGDWRAMPAEGITIPTSGGRSPEWTGRKYRPEDVWAYRPLRHPAVPALGAGAAPVNNPIDAFIRERLLEKGVARTAPPADRATLLRRVTLDLSGLPPTPEDTEAFLHDDAPDAFARVVERLLASPHYGEQWARHWLDVVRYADTSGYANDYERPNAWRYRDYVVRGFNLDRPYDRFVLEQLAGDEIDPADPELLVAVGFLRMGPWEQTGMSVAALTRQQFLDDVTHSAGVVFLGHALRCARCHDHKFDPVPTRDYYRLQAVFAPAQFAERQAPFLPSENTSGFAEGRSRAERRLREAQDYLAGIRKKSDDAVAAYLRERGVARPTDLPEDERPKRRFFGLSKLELSLDKAYQKRVDYFERERLRYEPLALSVYDGPPNGYTSVKAVNPLPERHDGPVPAVHVLLGGSLEAPAEAVTPGVLSALAPAGEISPGSWSPIPEGPAGRRLALARWIASPDNPLTARVIVNRVWQYHFGKGLVATPNNFGKMGKRPTHPELLEWLAAWFVEHGWSIKELHRLILSTAVYQQGGGHPDLEQIRRLDPNDDLLAYFPPRRLEAEEVRDGPLAVTGELNPQVGGPGVFPEINWEVALQPRHIMGSVAPAYQPSPLPRQRHRRTLYAFRYRTLSDPLLDAFDRPGSETSCERRDETTVTAQALALFNGEFAHGGALALAATLERRCDDAVGRIDRAFRLCTGRPPDAEESRLCLEHLARMTAYHREHPPTPTRLPVSVRRHMVEEMTGEEFEWEEELDVLRDYRPDVQPWDVGPETRALADVCLVLFNSNEFLYVR